MGIRDWFKSDAERLALPVPERTIDRHPPNASLVDVSRGAHDRIVEHLPRGVDVIRDRIDRKEAARWARSSEIAELAFTGNDQVLLGKHQGRLIGVGGDKPLITIASARSGKTSSVLKPALLTYVGSMLVLDPKGELAAATAEHRRTVLGQDVHILDPFECTKLPAATFNPLAEIDPASPFALDDADAVCQALIVQDDTGSDGSHWTNAAMALLRGLVLHTLQKPESERHLVTVRELLQLTYKPLLDLKAKLEREGAKDPAEAVQNALFLEMSNQGDAFGGALAGDGLSFLRKNPRERSAIISTAHVQTRFLDSDLLKRSLRSSDFRLSELGDRPTTLYLCLPASHMGSHFRWLRLIIRMSVLAMERRGPWPRGKPHILFMLEEFASLGHMDILASAAAYLPGFGARLWVVLQDIAQLKRHYRANWATFVGNAGALSAFANADKETLDLLSDSLGSLSFVRGQFGGNDDEKAKAFVDKERLAYGHELAQAFARAVGSQMLLVEGRYPMAIERLTHDDVERIQRYWRPS